MHSSNGNIQWYQSKFDAFEQRMNGEKSTPLHALRRDAFHQFAKDGFPTTNQEEWRFTNISPIAKIEFQPILQYESHGISRRNIEPYLLEESLHVIFINGMFSAELSDTELLRKQNDVLVGSLAETLKKNPERTETYLARSVKEKESAFTALNTAFLQDGSIISISQNVRLDQPIQLLFIATDSQNPFAAQPRNLILLGAGSNVKIIEQYIGINKNTYLTNAVTEIFLEENSLLEHAKLQNESVNAFHIGTTRLYMNASTRYLSNAIALGGSIVRNTITAVLDAEGSECTLNGLSLGSGTQIIDNHTAIDHAKPHCNSHELYKAILDEESKGIFNGKIFVRKDAQKTDAKQTNKTLLLSDNASINAKPQLEIFADDVKCTHGATIGQLDEEQIFYLRSRGIDLQAARDILTTAFAGDVVNRITIEPFRQQVEKMIHIRLDGRHSKN
jgi:Fe-S cluster assembly protein SufD